MTCSPTVLSTRVRAAHGDAPHPGHHRHVVRQPGMYAVPAAPGPSIAATWGRPAQHRLLAEEVAGVGEPGQRAAGRPRRRPPAAPRPESTSHTSGVRAFSASSRSRLTLRSPPRRWCPQHGEVVDRRRHRPALHRLKGVSTPSAAEGLPVLLLGQAALGGGASIPAPGRPRVGSSSSRARASSLPRPRWRAHPLGRPCPPSPP